MMFCFTFLLADAPAMVAAIIFGKAIERL